MEERPMGRKISDLAQEIVRELADKYGQDSCKCDHYGSPECEWCEDVDLIEQILRKELT
jgi:hypothetical protein